MWASIGSLEVPGPPGPKLMSESRALMWVAASRLLGNRQHARIAPASAEAGVGVGVEMMRSAGVALECVPLGGGNHGPRNMTGALLACHDWNSSQRRREGWKEQVGRHRERCVRCWMKDRRKLEQRRLSAGPGAGTCASVATARRGDVGVRCMSGGGGGARVSGCLVKVDRAVAQWQAQSRPGGPIPVARGGRAHRPVSETSGCRRSPSRGCVRLRRQNIRTAKRLRRFA